MGLFFIAFLRSFLEHIWLPLLGLFWKTNKFSGCCFSIRYCTRLLKRPFSCDRKEVTGLNLCDVIYESPTRQKDWVPVQQHSLCILCSLCCSNHDLLWLSKASNKWFLDRHTYEKINLTIFVKCVRDCSQFFCKT